MLSSQTGCSMEQIHQHILQQRETDVAFLYDIYSYAWYNRLVSALSAYDHIVYAKEFSSRYDLMVEPNRVQKILRTKIFAEYVALLESFGGLCVALKQRDVKSIRETFVNVEPCQIKEFYDYALKCKRNSILKLLNFPKPEKLSDAAQAKGLNDLDLTGFKISYRHLGEKIKEIAMQYVSNNSLLVRNYNKVKHCFPVIEGVNWIVPPIPEDRIAIYSMDSIGYLTMDQEQVVNHIESMRNVTIIGSELLAMCKCLSDSNLLFSEGS